MTDIRDALYNLISSSPSIVVTFDSNWINFYPSTSHPFRRDSMWMVGEFNGCCCQKQIPFIQPIWDLFPEKDTHTVYPLSKEQHQFILDLIVSEML